LSRAGIERWRIRPLAESRNLAVPAEEFHSKRKRILAGGGRKLVNKTFHDESARGVLDGAPPCAGHARFRERVLNTNVRRDVRQGGASAELVQPEFFRAFLAPLGSDGSRGLKMSPCRKVSVGVQRALQLVIRRGPVKIVLHVVFAGP